MGNKKDRIGKLTKEMQANVVGFLEMPPDIMLDLPKFTLIGNRELLMENHRGIIEYDKQQIKINSSLGEVTIKGRDLRLRDLKTAEMLVEGRITAFILED